MVHLMIDVTNTFHVNINAGYTKLNINKRFRFEHKMRKLSKFYNFGSKKAFSIILFVAFREFFVAPGVKFLKFFEFCHQSSFTLDTVSDVLFF